MKIICIGRNYEDHINELNNKMDHQPVVFMKPKNALVPTQKHLTHPDFTIDWEYEAEIVIRISKNAKYINEKHAQQYYDAYTLGLDMTARDLQNKLKSEGKPWEIAKAHDGSALLGKFIPTNVMTDIQNVRFSLYKNDQLVQAGNTEDMIFPIDKILAYVSNFFTLNIGDYIFTGTPSGVGSVDPGDFLDGYIGAEKVFHTVIK